MTYEINRDAVVVDTNVLYSGFSKGDKRYADVRAFFEIPSQLVIPLAVLVETWGLIVGRDGNWESGFELLGWLIDPSSGAVVINSSAEVAQIHATARDFHVDCVDAIIIHLAEKITRECRLRPVCQIATYDTRDFLSFLADRQFSVSILDLATLDITELDY